MSLSHVKLFSTVLDFFFSHFNSKAYEICSKSHVEDSKALNYSV